MAAAVLDGCLAGWMASLVNRAATKRYGHARNSSASVPKQPTCHKCHHITDLHRLPFSVPASSLNAASAHEGILTNCSLSGSVAWPT